VFTYLEEMDMRLLYTRPANAPMHLHVASINTLLLEKTPREVCLGLVSPE
jgi:hypothetical protein